MKTIITEILINKQTKGWLQDFFRCDQIPSESVNGRQFNGPIIEVITLGVVAQLRPPLLREAMAQCVGAPLLGLHESVHGARSRQKLHNSPVEALVVEVATTEDGYIDRGDHLQLKGSSSASLWPQRIHVLYRASPQQQPLGRCPVHARLRAFTDNLHLISAAVKVFLKELSLFFNPETSTQLHV